MICLQTQSHALGDWVNGMMCCLCSSKLGKEEIVSRLAVSRGRELVQLFDYNKEIIDRILPAYMNAMVRYQDRSLRSRDIGKEMLLLVSGTMNIANAIGRCGVKDANRFILFSNSRRLYELRSRGVGMKVIRKYRLKLDHDVASEVAITPLAND